MQIHLLGMHYIKQICLHMFFEANINVQNVLLMKKSVLARNHDMLCIVFIFQKDISFQN